MLVNLQQRTVDDYHQTGYQHPPDGALTYDYAKNRIYYRTMWRNLAWYAVLPGGSTYNYYYEECPANTLLAAQHIGIFGNLAIYGDIIYYVAIYHNDYSSVDSFRIHCLIDNGAGWLTNSPTYQALGHYGQSLTLQDRADAAGQVAVSLDGNSIFYIPKDLFFMDCYRKVDYWVYYWQAIALAIQNQETILNGPMNSLQFNGKNECFFIFAEFGGGYLRYFRFQQPYCSNPLIRDYLT